MKLGKWPEYLAMRQGIIRLNSEYRDLLSNDLGAIAGLLFDIGSGRYTPPPRDGDEAAKAAWEADLRKVREEAATARNALQQARDGDRTHTEIQGWLRDLGHALGFDVWIASNDQSRSFNDGTLGDRCLTQLPQSVTESPGADAVRLIDVLWLNRLDGRVAAAFEVEHTTSIYSGIVRLLDLAWGVPDQTTNALFLVAPDNREADVRSQLQRPAFRHIAGLNVRFLPYSELEKHREVIARFGEGLKAICAISRVMT